MATGAVVAAVVALPAAGGPAAAQAPTAARELFDGSAQASREPVEIDGIVGSAVDDTADDPFGTAPDALPADGPPATGEASSLALNGIPDVALRAYQAAAGALALADPSCGLDWALLAGIGRVESNHGRYGGAVVGEDGVSRPAILGVRLDGSLPGTMVIGDSDGGRLDGDDRYDRALGPMQFLPGSWSVFGTDGDGDGTRDPQNIHDAALAAAAYLCSGTDDLSTPEGASAAVRRYNNSGDYVRLVLDLADTYRRGITPPDLPVSADPDAVPVLPSPPTAPAAPPTVIGVNPGTPGTSPGGVDPSQPAPPLGSPSTTPPTSSTTSSSTTSTTSTTPSRSPVPVSPGSSSTSTSGAPGSSTTTSGSPSPTSSGTDTPSTTPSGTSTSPGDPTTTGTPGPTGSPTTSDPSSSPSPTDPCPTESTPTATPTGTTTCPPASPTDSPSDSPTGSPSP